MTFNTLMFVSEDLYSKPLESWSDRLSLSGEMLLRGIGTVFFVLALLWGILELFKVFVYTIPQKKAQAASKPASQIKEKPASSAKAKPVAAPIVTPVVPTVATPQPQEAELVAAISAAIAAYLDQPTTSFRVVSFKRTGKKK